MHKRNAFQLNNATSAPGAQLLASDAMDILGGIELYLALHGYAFGNIGASIDLGWKRENRENFGVLTLI